MQLQMSFPQTSQPADSAPVWATLDEQQRAEALAALARLIAKVADARIVKERTGDEEKGDE